MDDMVYDIEEIISHRKRPDGKYEYFVKWKVNLISHYLMLCFVVLYIFLCISNISYQTIQSLLLQKKTLNKFQGYDRSANTWEPEKNFESPKLLEDYHKSIRAASTPNVSARIKDDAPNTSKQKPKKFLVADDLLMPNRIKERNLVPEKVLNIFHVRDNEKDLVAYIRFKNQKEAQFVQASWAHKHCPQLVIEFYESRIFWRDRM